MNLEGLLLFFFSSITLTSAIFVIYSTNTIYSAFFLILVFTSTTALLLISEVEFLSLMLIIIYVGAITVLFIFVIMMLDINVLINKNKDKDNNFGYLPIICLIGFIFFIETYLMFSKTFTTYFHFLDSSRFFEKVFSKTIINHVDTVSNIETLGQVLYTYYSFFFLIAGIILLIALIGAITLTKKNKKKERFLTKNIYKQLSRDASKAVFNINGK